MISIIEFAIEIVIAIVALIIAILQWKEEYRISKEEKQEKVLREAEKSSVNRIVGHITAIQTCSDDIFDFVTQINQYSQGTECEPNEVFGAFDTMLERYSESFTKIEPILKKLYEELLKNEERFPMSYGYDRHINDLRQILDWKALERERRNNNYDFLRIRAHEILLDVWNNGGVLPLEVRLELGNITEQMVRSLEPYYSHAQKIQTVLFELSIKYNQR